MLGRTEKEILNVLSSRQFSLSYLKSLILIKGMKTTGNFYRCVSRLEKKGLLEFHSGNVVNLTGKGSELLRYFRPFESSRHQATILVLPETASFETGYSLNSIRRRKAPFCYLTFSHRLYVFKREITSKIAKKFPLFPLLRDYELTKMIPDLPLKGLALIEAHVEKTDQGFYLWPHVLEVLVNLGKCHLATLGKLRKQKQKGRKEVANGSYPEGN